MHCAPLVVSGISVSSPGCSYLQEVALLKFGVSFLLHEVRVEECGGAESPPDKGDL